MTYQNELIKQYEADGWLVLKTIRLNHNGYPDLFLFKDGQTLFIEVKEEKDTLKPLQKMRILELKRQGFDAFCMQKNKGKIF